MNTAIEHSELKNKIREIISEVSEVDVVPDNKPFKDLGIDSMMAIEIIASVEKTYKLKIPESELQSIVDLDSVYELVKNKLSAN